MVISKYGIPAKIVLSTTSLVGIQVKWWRDIDEDVEDLRSFEGNVWWKSG